MSTADDLATLQANNTADASALADLEASLNQPTQPSVGDQVLQAVVPVVTQAGLVAVFGDQPLVDALTAEGFTVTPPAPAAPAESAPADSTDSSAPAPGDVVSPSDSSSTGA